MIAPTPTDPRRSGVLLLNLGTPDSPTTADVRRYLREFLSDPRLMDIHPVSRWILLHLVILPFRPGRSARAYRRVWTEAGSPLLLHGEALAAALRARLGEGVEVRLAMRYGKPSIGAALEAFAADGVDRVFAIPLFAQWTSATSGSAIARVMSVAAERWSVPRLHFAGPFFDDGGYIEALTELARPAAARADHVLFSYHSVPERHLRKADLSAGCPGSHDCCAVLGDHNRGCYRAQCFATSRALAASLALPADRHTTAFQSRLGRDRWIGPATDATLRELGRAGKKRVAVLEPGFAADCLETIEEIGIRGAEQLREAGGGELELVPCLNASERWVAALEAMIRRECAWIGRRT